MFKNFKKEKLFLAVAGALALASQVGAEAFSTSTAPTIVNSLISDVALIIGAVVGTILGLLAALMGLGWGVKKFRRYITGRKF